MAAQMGVSLVYSEFHGGVEATQEMLETLLRQYDRDQVIRLCCLADFAAQATAGFHEPRFTDLLLTLCFPKHVVLQARQKRPSNPGRFVFIRHAVLLVLKTALAVCKNGLDPFEPGQLPVFSDAFLMANEVQVYLLPTNPETDNSVNVLVNFVGIMEYLQTSLKNQIVRSNLSVEIIEELRQDPEFKQYFDLPERFENDLSISIRTFRNYLLGILTKPLNVRPTSIPMQGGNIDLTGMLNAITVSPAYFSQTKVSAETVNRVFNAISISPDELSEDCARTRKAVYDFTEIKNRPLIKLNNDYIITDIGFVAEKIETGPFWHVMSTLQSAKDRRRALSFWGHVFERYTKKILENTIDGGKNVLIANPLFAPKAEGQQVCDIFIRCGSFLVMIECKGGFLSRDAKYSGVPGILEAAIESKLIKTDDDRSMGVEQLANSISKLFDRKGLDTVDGYDVSGIKWVYPVLVLRDEIGAAPDLNRRLHQHFNMLIDRRELRAKIPGLFCLSNAALEHISTYLDQIRFTDILDDRKEADNNLYMPFWLVPIAVLEKAGRIKNKFFDTRFFAIMNEVTHELFSKKFEST
ncbi:MAG TPA: hypothetical protein VGH51_00780 [Candidatus Angelobacter sp.]|jgi:hypothetical protein